MPKRFEFSLKDTKRNELIVENVERFGLRPTARSELKPLLPLLK